jgi:predicted DNA-binding protein with PD1-like motif
MEEGMRYSEGSLGRVFVLRLDDGEPLNTTVEAFARAHGIERGMAFYVGGGAGGTSLVVGPDAFQTDAVVPLYHALRAPSETFAFGTLFPNGAGDPVLHMHAACGREGDATVGCTRAGLETWLIGELVLIEIVGTEGSRRLDPASGFELLELS